MLKYLTYIGKLAGFVATLNVIPFVDPAVGVLVFAAASLLKDTVNRIGDLVDDGFAEPASRAERHPLASLEEFVFSGRLLKGPLAHSGLPVVAFLATALFISATLQLAS